MLHLAIYYTTCNLQMLLPLWVDVILNVLSAKFRVWFTFYFDCYHVANVIIETKMKYMLNKGHILVVSFD